MPGDDSFIAHLIFSTKGWEPLISSSLLTEIIERLKRNFERKGAALIFANGREEHIHILGKFRDYQAFSRIVGWSKGECSHWINQKHPTLGFYWQKGFWHEIIPEEHIQATMSYIEDQDSIHKDLTFMDEITKFRKRSNCPKM